MSKRLYVLRHAKSSWKHPELTDHERPLAGRGRRPAKAIARHLDEHEVAAELVLCSPARRARETFERIEPALPAAAVTYEPRLYAATADALLERRHGVPDGIASVMLIGHNPAIEQLALELAHPLARAARARDQVPDGRARDVRVRRPELARRPSRRGDARRRHRTPRSRDRTHNRARTRRRSS
jgi:phosphohistidine phosphatase